MTKRIGWWLRCLADRIDPDHAPRAVGMSFTFEEGAGIVWHDDVQQGCPVWYLGEDDYAKAHGGPIETAALARAEAQLAEITRDPTAYVAKVRRRRRQP